LKKVFKKLLGPVFVVLIAILAGWLYSRNAVFRLSDIQIQSADVDLESEVKKKIVGLLGRNLFTISLADLESQILQIPRVKVVSLLRQWPNRVTLKLESWDPVAIVFFQKNLWAVDERGILIFMVLNPIDLPLLENFKIGQDNSQSVAKILEQPEGFFVWLKEAERSEPQGLDISKFHAISWDETRGVLLSNYEQDLLVELGAENFKDSWRRASLAYALLAEKNQNPYHLDATYRSRVVAKSRLRLQNPDNRLNLEELVHRKDPVPAAAR